MRTLFIQPKTLGPLAVDYLHYLPQLGLPLTPLARPSVFAVVARWAEHLRPIRLIPVPMALTSLKPGIGQVWATGLLTDHWQSLASERASRQEVLGVGLVLGARRRNRVAGQHADAVDRTQHVETIVPAQAVRPAGVGDTVEPARSRALVVAYRHTHTVEHLVGLLSTAQQGDQALADHDNAVVGIANEPVELRAIGQARKRLTQMLEGITDKRSFTDKLLPLGHQGQRDNFAVGQTWLWARPQWSGRLRFDRIIDQHVQSGQKGVEIQHGCAPFLGRI